MESHGELIAHDDNQLSTQVTNLIDLAIKRWLDAKSKRSGSGKTLAAYRDTVASFRAALAQAGADLYADPRGVAMVAQVWAGESMRPGHEVRPATYNQRLACVSSFYVYAKKQGMFEGENPIDRVDRRKVQGYASAAPIEDLRGKLQAIDRSTLAGKRDYALLTVASTTGRRLTELVALLWRDLQFTDQGKRILITWQRAKGGKVMSDRLTEPVSRALIEYLHAAYGPALGSMRTDAPIWISTSPRSKGKALGIQTIADICQKHLGTPKVHALRHTFAHAMEQSGAPVSEIQARLGHDSLATTGRYLAALSSADNKHADKLAEMFGLE